MVCHHFQCFFFLNCFQINWRPSLGTVVRLQESKPHKAKHLSFIASGSAKAPAICNSSLVYFHGHDGWDLLASPVHVPFIIIWVNETFTQSTGPAPVHHENGVGAGKCDATLISKRGLGGDDVKGPEMPPGDSTEQKEPTQIKGEGALKTHLVALSEILTSSLWLSTT